MTFLFINCINTLGILVFLPSDKNSKKFDINRGYKTTIKVLI